MFEIQMVGQANQGDHAIEPFWLIDEQ